MATSTSSTIPSPSQPPSQLSNDTLFHQLSSYPFSTDPGFQGGLASLLSDADNPSPEQAEHLTLKAQCYYFSRKINVPIDFDAYQIWRRAHSLSSPSNADSMPNGTTSTSHQSYQDQAVPSLSHHEPNPSSTNAAEPPAPYPTSFSQIVDLITNGQPIPGIKEVPDTVLEGHASQATTAKRKKPWENQLEAEENETSTSINAS